MVGVYLTYAPVEWVNEDGGSLIAFDTADRSQYEEMSPGAPNVSVTSTAFEGAMERSLLSPSPSVAGLGFSSRPSYPEYPCVNDSQAYSGPCNSGIKVRGTRSLCPQCTAIGRGERGRTHGSNSHMASDKPITYTEYLCPNKDKYHCTIKVKSPRDVCPTCIEHGRPPPAYKSTSIDQDLDSMGEYVEESGHEWILPDHE